MPGKTILLVEDDFMNMRLVEHILEAEGYAITKATTAQEALDKIGANPPDLIEAAIWLTLLVATASQLPKVASNPSKARLVFTAEVF